jgi:hypothetical protein
MTGIRTRKQRLINVLKARTLGSRLTPAQIAQLELMYRRASSIEEQDQVTKALDNVLNGWRTGTDAYSLLLQDDDPFEDDDLSPSLQTALDKTQADFGKKPT